MMRKKAAQWWFGAAALLCVAGMDNFMARGGEASIDEYGNVEYDEEEEFVREEEEESIRYNEELVAWVTNESAFRVDIYWDDGQYGAQVSTLEPGQQGGVNTFLGHSFFVTRHGVKEGLFTQENDQEEQVRFTISQRHQKLLIPANAAPSSNPCQDRFSICESQAKQGRCSHSPGWMIVHCCKSCDPYLDSSRLIDPAVRCSKEQLNTPDPVWQPGDLNNLFEAWAANDTLKTHFGLQVLSSPSPQTHAATWEKAKEGGPWVVIFDNFLNDQEVHDLIRGGELEGYERSTDQGAANALGEQEKIVSQTRTSSNAWCMNRCEALPGVKSATDKIEQITGIPRVNYESFQLLNYQKNQFYRSHHDSSRTDPTPPGPRILTFFLYLTDVEEGGETYFNKLDLKVKPKKGRALVWPSVTNDKPHYWDSRMYHEAKDVIRGKKLAANHWIHLNDYKTPNDWGCTGSFS